jgi:hypothetical protein
LLPPCTERPSLASFAVVTPRQLEADLHCRCNWAGPVGLDAGRLEWTNTHGMELTHYRDRGGQGGRVGVTQFMAAAACDGA